MSHSKRTIVYFAGSRWDEVPGTDRRLTMALGQNTQVLWVDPPFSALSRHAKESSAPRSSVTSVAPGVLRLRVRTVPGSSRFGMRAVASRDIESSLRRVIRALNAEIVAVVVATPRAAFPRSLPGTRILYVTDDWIAGAALMKLSERAITRTLLSNMAMADVRFAVSPDLASSLSARDRESRNVEVLPNGCTQVDLPEAQSYDGEKTVALVGQLNERLDMDSLDAVARTGVRIVVMGPRTEKDEVAGRRLDAFLAQPNVEWLGSIPYAELPAKLSTVSVGLTPYIDNSFNRSSFPLKTLEYLASGLAVVSTDLPAVRWLGTTFIDVASNPTDFAQRVIERVSEPQSRRERQRRAAFASNHTWESRAHQLSAAIGAPTAVVAADVV